MRRTLAFAAVAATAALFAAPAQAAPAQTAALTTDKTKAAAGWLAGQAKADGYLESSYVDEQGNTQTFPDAGLTADALLAFNAAGVAQDNAAKAVTWFGAKANLDGYVGDGTTESYGGQLGKLSLALSGQGADPKNFGGRDLLKELAALESKEGRYVNKSAWGDYSNVLGQSYGVLAVTKAEGKAPAKATGYLVESQCTDGGFPQNFGQEKCESSVDATGVAVQALLGAGRTEEADAGLAWLLKAQQGSGGFNDGSADLGKHPVNANSTGNALQALRAGGKTAAADKALTFLYTLQIGCSGPEAQRGAVTHSGKFTESQAPRATTGAVLGMAGTPLLKISSAGASKAAPKLDCTPAPTPAPTTTPTATPAPTTGAAVPPAENPANPGELAKTGAQIGVFLAIGGGLLAVGSLILVLARRRSA
ncbi:LPXTG cell wall anchor domain-containing protein [Longispora albida]|uniref:LPXTG cell wall anchor domain-containing protein n=1 Tax=Longispora albida TaxID=203523 RepID=UPI0003625EFF|nr:LPXTG cell wall anchor domain-containing protein [Longispora albida]